MALFGLGLIPAAGALILLTGLPAYMILLLLSVMGALGGLIGGAFTLDVLSALPTRLILLLENDLLQALPLYVCVGILLNRLPILIPLSRCLHHVLGRSRGAQAATTLVVGGLLGPMNGSVGAHVMGLSQSLYPRLLAHHIAPAIAQAHIAAASTLGVVIPPSLVLILLGDAMMNAHIIALQGSTRSERIINTHDLLMGVLIPALIVWIGFIVAAFLQTRCSNSAAASPDEPPLNRADIARSIITLCVLMALLGGVASGLFYAVEAAATGALLLLIYGVISRVLTPQLLRDSLRDMAANTGALFALLMGATSFTLILRLLQTDKLITDWLLSVHTSSFGFLLLILGLVACLALVLDAFEMIFVMVPILAPPLLMRVEDAVWVAVCLLLTLQMAFLIPPVGYALAMARSLNEPQVTFKDCLKRISPYLGVQILVLGAVLIWPSNVHRLEAPGARERSLPTPPHASAGPNGPDSTLNSQLNQIRPPDDLMPLPLQVPLPAAPK